MNVLFVSPELTGIGAESGVSNLVLHVSDVLSSQGEQVKLLYSGASRCDLDPAWSEWYSRRDIEVLQLAKHPWHKVPSHYNYINIPAARNAEAVAASIPPNIDVVYFLQRGGNGFHLVRQARFSRGRRPALVTILDGGSEWQRACQGKFPEAHRGGHDLNDDMLERYVARHSDYVLSPDRYMVDWLAQQGWPEVVNNRARVLGYPHADPPSSAPRQTPSKRTFGRLVCLSQAEDHAGVELFLRALATMETEPDLDLRDIEQVVFLQYGGSDEKFALTAKEGVERLGLRATIHACPTSAALRNLLKEYVHDGLVVVPRVLEDFPYSVIEAVSTPGLHVLGPRHSRVSELLSGSDNSHLFEPYPLPLARTIATACRNFGHDTQPAGVYDPHIANKAWLDVHLEICHEALRLRPTLTPGSLPTQSRHTEAKSLDIFVTYFNKQQYLPQLLLSLEHQTTSDFTVYVVDDGSTHAEARAVFEAMKAKYEPRGWRFVTQANQYVSRARNVVAKLGNAEYMCFLDADDVVAPQLVERFLNAIRISQDDCVGCYYMLFEGDKFPYALDSGLVESHITGRLPLLGNALATGTLFNFMGGCCSIIRRSVFEQLGGYSEDPYVPFEDWDFHVRLLLQGYQLDILPEYLYYYRQHQASLLHAESTAAEYAGYARVLRAYAGRLSPLGLGAMPAATMGMYQQLDSMWAQEDERNRYVDELHARLSDHDRDLDELHEQASQRSRYVGQLHEELNQRNRDLRDLTKQLGDRDRDLDELREKLTARDQNMEELQRQVRSTQKQFAEASRQFQLFRHYADQYTIYEVERAKLQSSLAFTAMTRFIWPMSRKFVPDSARTLVKRSVPRAGSILRHSSNYVVHLLHRPSKSLLTKDDAPEEHGDNPCPIEYLEIQAIFARRAAELTGITYPESLAVNTDLQGTLGLPYSVEPTHPDWQQFVAELQENGSGIEQAYEIYTRRYNEGLISDESHDQPVWGCFGYTYVSADKSIRIHFSDKETSGYGPLSRERKDIRLAELRSMFEHIYRVHPEAERVAGGSWLLCRFSYSRLFPPKQNATDYPAELKLGGGGRPGLYLWGTGVWGQFMRSGNRLNEEAAVEFLDRLAKLEDANDFADCFPSQLILTNGPISNFYEFYGITGA